MAASSLLTSLESFDSSPSYFNIGSGGGATDNDDIVIQGTGSGGRRCDAATDKGFGATFTAVDLSGDGEHLKLWVLCNQWPAVTNLSVRISDGTNDDDHIYPVGDIPFRGGFIPVWCDVSRGAGAADESNIDRFGAFITIGNVTGAGSNFIVDEIHHGTSGYLFDGTGGDFDDFRTLETTNVEGVFVTQDGADILFARLELGSATLTTFSGSGFTVVCPDQALVSTTFMGLSIDLQNASTTVNLSTGAFVSGNPVGATNRPDVLVSGTAGSFDMDTMLFNGLRTIELTDACSLTNSTVLNTGVVEATAAGTAGADLSGTKIIDSTVAVDASALIWNVNADPTGELDDMSFTKGLAAHHALELGTTSPLSVTLNGWIVTGFNTSNEQNDSTFFVARTGGDVTINVVGGSGNFSYKSAGANVTIVVDPVTTQITIRDQDTNDVIGSARVIVEAGDDTGDLPFEVVVTITASATTATVEHTTHGMANGDKVTIRGTDATQLEYTGVFAISNVSANAYDYTMGGSPSSPALGTINSTGVVLEGITDGSGIISASASYSVNQNIRGKARKSTVAPFYKPSDFFDVIDSVAGLTKTIALVLDQ